MHDRVLSMLILSLITSTFAFRNTGVNLCFYKKTESSPCGREQSYICCDDLAVNECCKNWKEDPIYCGTMGGQNLDWGFTVNLFKTEKCDRGQFGMCYSSTPGGTCCSRKWNQYPGELNRELQDCSMRLEGRTDEVFKKRAVSEMESEEDILVKRRVSRGRSTSKQPERPPVGGGKSSDDPEKPKSGCRYPNVAGYVDDRGVRREIRFDPETQWKNVRELLDTNDYRGLAKYPASGGVASQN